MRKAAFFELRADYYGRPFEDGIIRALLDAGFGVDLFAPDGALPQTIYPDSVRRLSIEYRLRSFQQLLHIRDYDLYLGTADLPMAFAGIASRLAARPVVTAADEIFTGGYEGSATRYWKSLARSGMRRATFTILTDLCRIPLQREYAKLPRDHEFLSYPSCYAFPYSGPPRDEARRALGLAPEEFVISLTGTFTSMNGADQAVRLLDAIPDARLMIQTGGHRDAPLDAMLMRDPRILHLPERLGWTESMAITAAADVGLVLYLSPKPQFQLMGVSSQKLCTYLWLGIPVIASRQESFSFIEQSRCGELIDAEGELADAVRRIRVNCEAYARNAPRAIAEYVRPAEKLKLLAERFRRR